jgi:hypothetical protein
MCNRSFCTDPLEHSPLVQSIWLSTFNLGKNTSGLRSPERIDRFRAERLVRPFVALAHSLVFGLGIELSV